MANISPQTAAVWVTLAWVAVLQGRATSAWIPHRVTSPTSRKPALTWASQEITASSQASSCGSPPRAEDGSLQSPGPPWAGGAQLLHCGLHQGLWGNLSSGAQSTCSASFSNDIGVCRVIPLTFSQSTLPWLQLKLCKNFFFYLLRYVYV